MHYPDMQELKVFGFGLALGVVFTLVTEAAVGRAPHERYRQGHQQGACDMACGSHSEAQLFGQRLRCICGHKTIKWFPVQQQVP